MESKKYYITTAIDYVNARPHVGHAFEKVLADALARWNRLQGKEVFFLTGVDENAQKNVQAAEKEGIPVKAFVDKNTKFFIELCEKLNISYDDFVRTSEKEHAKVVQKIIQKIIDKGDIYKDTYSGLYCSGCEAYYTEKDLVNGKCPEHETKPEHRKEEAYFFKLSKYEDKLLEIIPNYVIPKSKANESLARIKEGLKDICISRKGVDWGISFPNDKDFKIWVWVDALINYISGLKGNEAKYWPAQTHVIGKGINWFHSVIWPSLLLSAGYKLPKNLLVHGYLNIGGKKMSKSIGNTIDPLKLLEKYPTDSVRYSLLKNSVFDDSDYSEEILIERHNNELADKLGNLVSRVSSLTDKYGVEKVVNFKKINVEVDVSNVVRDIKEHFERYELDKALASIFAFVDTLNQWVQELKPWETHDKKDLYELAIGIRLITILLWPFIPETSEEIAKLFGFKIELKEIEKPLKIIKIKKAAPLFEKIK